MGCAAVISDVRAAYGKRVLELGVLDLTGSSCHAVHVLQMATV